MGNIILGSGTMKAVTIFIITLLLSFYIAQCSNYDQLSKNETDPLVKYKVEFDSTNFDQEMALEELREQIKGWENDPSESVYLNIQTLNKIPAGKFLSIMNTDYSKALGVTCLHCHDAMDWSSDKKAAKNIAREMSKMVDQINNNILADIEALGERTGAVTCNTCHRGDKKPELNKEGL